jgi:hypothetical protein
MCHNALHIAVVGVVEHSRKVYFSGRPTCSGVPDAEHFLIHFRNALLMLQWPFYWVVLLEKRIHCTPMCYVTSNPDIAKDARGSFFFTYNIDCLCFSASKSIFVFFSRVRASIAKFRINLRHVL